MSVLVRCPAGPRRGTVGDVIEVNELTKRYGRTTAVDNLTFTVRPGHVTGFLGPNGAGKSTTLRMVLGLNDPTSGTITVDGHPLRDRSRGLRHVGALLDASDVHGGRSGRAHLHEVGLAGAAGRRIGGYSLGMKQRLGIARVGGPVRPVCCQWRAVPRLTWRNPGRWPWRSPSHRSGGSGGNGYDAG